MRRFPTLVRAALVLCTLGTPSVATALGNPAPPAAPAARPAPTPAPAPPAPEAVSYTFQIVLVLADNNGSGSSDSLPPNAQKALADVRDFLPYKSYKLVDLAWLRTSRNAQAQLNGPKGETLELDLAVAAETGNRLNVRHFQLAEVAMLPPPGASPESTPGARRVRNLLETNFGMLLGETVVVGTAKVDGPGKALIAILSVLP